MLIPDFRLPAYSDTHKEFQYMPKLSNTPTVNFWSVICARNSHQTTCWTKMYVLGKNESLECCQGTNNNFLSLDIHIVKNNLVKRAQNTWSLYFPGAEQRLHCCWGYYLKTPASTNFTTNSGCKLVCLSFLSIILNKKNQENNVCHNTSATKSKIPGPNRPEDRQCLLYMYIVVMLYL